MTLLSEANAEGIFGVQESGCMLIKGNESFSQVYDTNGSIAADSAVADKPPIYILSRLTSWLQFDSWPKQAGLNLIPGYREPASIRYLTTASRFMSR